MQKRVESFTPYAIDDKFIKSTRAAVTPKKKQNRDLGY
ncbi:MAG: DUF1269 domain-containing protein [Firmicutes bacterium]|nr:DUF1269 domain-containing protein [Bacillota bacterium]